MEERVNQRNYEALDYEVRYVNKVISKIKEYLSKKNNERNNGEGMNEAVMDIRLQHLRELTTQIDKINQEKANQNTSDSEVAERPFDDSNRYKIQNVYDNLAKRGELQHRMRVRIEQFFEKKLEQYNICDFSSSAKLGLEITKLLSYIPNQLKPDYDYK